jgi:hypothetical protein
MRAVACLEMLHSDSLGLLENPLYFPRFFQNLFVPLGPRGGVLRYIWAAYYKSYQITSQVLGFVTGFKLLINCFFTKLAFNDFVV